ncbi:nucleic-acid-binding protein from transposon X-element, partial [Trichonephila clavipes]
FDPARGRVRPRCVFRSTSWITMDMSASRTDVASSVEVSDLFSLETMSFDVMAATDLIDNCTTCAESEDLCGVLDEILFTLEDVDAEAQITPERLRLLSFLDVPHCSLTRFAAEAATSETPARIAAERRSVEEAGEIGAKASSHIRLLAISKTRLLWRKGESSAEESSVEIASAKSAKPVIAQSSPAAKAAESVSAPRTKVSVEPLNKSTLPPQCYRCQEFFHHSRFCTRAPKCLKCSGGHLTSECTKSAKAPAKCANCSGPHPANFSGCPKNPINTKTTKTKAAKNVWKERAAARKQNTNISKPSFAEVVKGSSNNALDAKEVMTKMAQMMSQWGEMLSLLQSKL